LQAAILAAKLPFLERWTNNRIEKAALYKKHLGDVKQVRLPVERQGSKHSYHLYVIRAEHRNELMEFLKEAGIETAIHYPTALPNLPCYEYLGYKKSDFPVSTRYQDQILSMPMYPELTEEMITHVAETIKSFYK
jgi:dTDP-4-amino-4,6-dideoxygalactose transaminase